MPQTPKQVEFELTGKDPDLPASIREWLECGEYYRAVVKVDPKTGKGTIEFVRP